MKLIVGIVIKTIINYRNVNNFIYNGLTHYYIIGNKSFIKKIPSNELSEIRAA